MRRLPVSLRILPIVTLAILSGCRDFGNPSDPDAGGYTVRSEAFLKRLGDAEPVAGDTVRLYGGVTSDAVEKAGLVARYAWDLDGDGHADTAVAGNDSLSLVVRDAGSRQVGLTLTDKAGLQSSATLDFRVHPSLSGLFRIQGFDTACPAYAQEPILMRVALALSHFTIEKTREEGLNATDLALNVARAVTGTAFPIGLLDGFDYSYGKGVYHFRNNTFTLDAAFLYGPGIAGHAEGDTLRANLFALDSYVTGIHTTLFPPDLKYTRGPLADLIDGDISVDLDDIEHPKFDFHLDFNRLRFTFSRTTRTLFVLSNQEITLANALFFTLYEGKARIAPLYPPDLIRLYGRDSLELDFSGTRVSSPELPIAWPYEENGVKDTAVYRLALVQETLRQNYRFGDAGGVKKVFGTYSAANRLGAAGEPLEAVWFKGGYSSTTPDSARFFCREAMDDDQFYGSAAFETETSGRGSFASKRYGYEFGFPFSTVEPWKGGSEGVPGAVVREMGGL
ncbi:MAG: hypothetical protein JWO30_4367 [Fibrobacteres bacterium]|nr:hypothetical protein [Fibrobacterota bacterium]